MIVARHALTDDGVVLSFRRNGVTALCVALSESDAKRLAWSVLADLDPDEADACHLGKPPAKVRIRGVSGTFKAGSKTHQVLQALADGPQTTVEIETATGIDRKHIPNLCRFLSRGGLACRADSKRGPGTVATWTITPKGRASL